MNNTEITNKRTIPQVSIDTTVLYDRIIKAKIGDFISYNELSQLLNRNVQKEARVNLTSARRKALNNNKILFECVSGRGIKRLNDIEMVETGQSTLTKIKRAARLGAKKITCVKNFNELPNDVKIKHNANLSALGVISLFSKNKSISKIEDQTKVSNDLISIGKTMELFNNNQ